MFQFGGLNMMFPLRNFEATYKCFSVSMLPGNDRQDVDRGGKIIMPPSALDTLTRLNVEYPMLFKLRNPNQDRTTHAGVLEFVADEGRCYLPYWMMRNLLLSEGDIIKVESVSLQVATYSKFQPQHTDFLDITNPKAVLENALRNYACLTKGDVVAIPYNKKIYELCVLETKPGDAVSIIECDMNVEFEAPVGYKETDVPMREVPAAAQEQEPTMEDVPDPFGGAGLRLDGKKKRENQFEQPVLKKVIPRGIPDYEYKFGTLTFDRSVKAAAASEAPSIEEARKMGFDGEGNSLKSRK